MFVVNQPWDGRGHRMGDQITRLLEEEEPRFEVFRACVAFVKTSGMLRLAPSLESFLNRGSLVEIVAGLDEGITTKQGLELVHRYSTVAYVFCNPGSTFHPKVYLFEKPQQHALAFVGSSNLTSGGLYTNYEANLGLELDLTVTTDMDVYRSILSVFLNACDVNSGNARELNAELIQSLVETGKIADETYPRRKGRSARSVEEVGPDLFPRTPVPPAPPVVPQLVHLIPRLRPTGDPESDRQSLAEFHPWQLFVMVLGDRDTRQRRGYSRDVFIPLAARDFNPGFWGWQAEFRAGATSTVGSYLERRIDMLVRPVAGQAQVVAGARLYYYDIKDEFRLNCGRLIEGAHAGDLLVVQRSPAGTFYEGRTYEYEATVIGVSHPEYMTLGKECSNWVPRSRKRWGYA